MSVQIMRKIIISTCLFFCIALVGLAQSTLHSVVLIDKQDGATLNGRLQNQERIHAEIDTIVQFTKMAHKAHILADNEFTGEGLERLIAGMNHKSDDVILFYFSGREHIGRAAGGSSHQLKMGDSYVDLNRFYASLKGKVRLCLVLVDLCNTQVAYRDEYSWPAADRAKYEVLFGQSSGSLLAVNHVPREQSGITVSENGSIFTQALVQALHMAQPEKSWLATMSELRSLAIRRSGGRLNPQVTVEVMASQNQSDFMANTKSAKLMGDPAPSKVVYKEVTRPGDKPENTDQSNETTDQPTVEPKNEPTVALRGIEAAKAESTKAVFKFQEQMQALTNPDADPAVLIEEIMRLFVTEDRMLEITRLGGRKSRTGARSYFSRLLGQRKKYQISISYYQPTEILELTDQGNGVLHGNARIFQEFRKTSPTGKLIYGDRVVKLVALYVRPLADGTWKVGLGNISVEPGSTQPLPTQEVGAAPIN